MTASKNVRKSKVSKRNSKKVVRSGTLVTPFPPLKVSTTRYTEQKILTEAVAGTGVINVWCPSSLFDPDNTGAGHQPMFYDQLCTSTGPYLRYRALRTTARITIANASPTPLLVGWSVTSFATPPATLSALIERPWSGNCMLASNLGGDSKKDWVINIDHAKAMGISKQHLLNDEYYSGAYNGAPNNNCFLSIWLVGQSGVVCSAYVKVELDTTSQFYSLGNTTSS